MKSYGLCRERHCLWAVPLLILQKIPCFAEALRADSDTPGKLFVAWLYILPSYRLRSALLVYNGLLIALLFSCGR